MFFLLFPVQRAIIWSVLAGYLLLPVRTEFNLPGIPSMDKTTIPSLCALIFALVMAGRSTWKIPRSTTAMLLIAMYVLVPFLTGWNNQEPLILGDLVIPGMRPYDWFSAAATRFLYILPFVIGIGALADERSQATLIKAFVVAALVYTLPILWELRMSPQLHVKLYGFFPHEFQQMVRDGGYRPVVFLGHGLLVSTFIMMACLAAISMWRQKLRLEFLPASLAVLYLAVILVLCKSFGAILICIAMAGIFITFSQRSAVRLLVVIALLIVAYPSLRGANLFPTSGISTLAHNVSPARASSLDFRFKNEDMLLNKARQKPFFGWGTWGRNSMMMSEDGQHVRRGVTDGQWIIEFGSFGWIGYISSFGLLCLPFVLAFRKRRTAEWTPSSVTLLFMLLANLIDLIPNSSLTPLTWLIAGSLCGSLLRKPEYPRSLQTAPIARSSAGPAETSAVGLLEPRQSILK